MFDEYFFSEYGSSVLQMML